MIHTSSFMLLMLRNWNPAFPNPITETSGHFAAAGCLGAGCLAAGCLAAADCLAAGCLAAGCPAAGCLAAAGVWRPACWDLQHSAP
eukprot:60432-Pelagomonas_calceolata.AAC.3